MSIDSNLPCQKKAPLTPQPKSYSTFPKSLISVHHCLFGLFGSKENWLTCTLRSRSRWVVRHWAAPSEKGGHTGGLDHRRARQGWIVLVFWTILEDSNLVIFSLALTEWPHRDQQIRRSDEPAAEKKNNETFSHRRLSCHDLPSHFVVSGEILSTKWHNCMAGRSLDTQSMLDALAHVSHEPISPYREQEPEGQRVDGGRVNERKKGREDKDGEWQLQSSLKTDENNTIWRQTAAGRRE